MANRKFLSTDTLVPAAGYDGLLGEVVVLLESARRTAARAVNAVMTATYWEIGRRIVEVEQRGSTRAEYGDVLIKRLAADLTARFGVGCPGANSTECEASTSPTRTFCQRCRQSWLLTLAMSRRAPRVGYCRQCWQDPRRGQKRHLP